MKTPREKTVDEIRDEFLAHVRSLVTYWNKLDGKDSPRTQKERLEGLAFSIMVLLDGGTMLPGFIVAPCPHESDKEYKISQGEDYYPYNDEKNVNGDIAGCLHELLKI